MRKKPRVGSKQDGFTLLELMIVVVIVGLLASVAYPSFRDQARRSARSDATTALSSAIARQEQYFADNKSYTATLADLDMTALTENGYYQIQVDAATTGCPLTRCFAMRAVPQGGQAEDTACGSLTINSSGEKSATGSDGASCW